MEEVMKEIALEFAEAIVNDFIIDDGDEAQCLSCNSFGEYPERIKHTSVCIVLKAKQFLQENGG